MLRITSVALLWGAALLSIPALADDPAPTPPSPTPAPEPPPETGPPPTNDAAGADKSAGDDDKKKADEEEDNKLLEELQAEDTAAAKNAPAAPAVPDLSQVNLGAAIPGAASMNPDISVILDVAGAAFGVARASKPGSKYPDDVPLMTGGHDPTSNGFTLRQVELSFAASVDPFLRFDSNIVLKDSIEVEEAYATTLQLPWSLQARAGEFLSKFGRLNEQHPHAWWFVSQPLVYGAVMGEDNFRGLGGEVSWLTPLPWPVTLIAEVQGTSGACCSRTFSPEADTPVPVKNALDLVYTGVIEQFFPVSDDVSVLWGLDAMLGPTPYIDAGARGEIWGTDLLIRYKPAAAQSRWFLEFLGEGMVRTRHPSDADYVTGAVVDGGGYAQLVWHPNPEWGAGVRYDYFDGLEGDVATANGGLGPNSQRGSVVGEFSPTHFSRIQVEANAGTRGQGDLLWGAMINLEVSIGAHGAHAF